MSHGITDNMPIGDGSRTDYKYFLSFGASGITNIGAFILTLVYLPFSCPHMHEGMT